MSTERIWTAALIVIGDEILSGRTADRNIAQIAGWLQVQGIRLAEVRVVADVEAAIVEAVNTLRARNDCLFTTGGIGPTHDDITVDAIAAALGVPVVEHPEARAILEEYYSTKGGTNPARLRMARVPEGAELIPNRISGAPGNTVGGSGAGNVIAANGGEGRYTFKDFPADRAPIDIGSYHADDGAFRAATGWAPLVGLDEGLRLTLDWYRTRLENLTRLLTCVLK